jgi:MoaA/NifB/PqqE/SkfB family radical SAM enzyme
MNLFDEIRVPATVIVELTNHCNLRCPLCTTHVAMMRPRGFMEFPLFKRMIDELSESGLNPKISFNMCGEPLLHPEAPRFVRHAAERGFRTYISTNVTRLSLDLGEELIRAGLAAIALCIDGASAASHEAYRVGSSFKTVRSNAEGFLATRRRLGSGSPYVTIQTLLTRGSEGEMEQILDWAWDADADEVHFKSLSLGSTTSPAEKLQGNRLLPQNALLRRSSAAPDHPCRYPDEHIMVYWSGELGVCCIDYSNMAGLPGILGRGFLQSLAAAEVMAARRKGLQRQLPMCGQCQAVKTGFRGLTIRLSQLREGSKDKPCWQNLLQARLEEAGVQNAAR